MKWGGGMRKLQITAIIVIIVILIPSVVILCDFIGFQNAINTYEKVLPTSAWVIQPPLYIPHYGYVPFGWRGNFQKIWFRNYLDDEYAKTKDLQDYIQIDFTMDKTCNNKNIIVVNLTQSGDDFWGTWELTEAGKKLLEDPNADEYLKKSIRKPFGTFCEVYVHPDYDKKTLLV